MSVQNTIVVPLGTERSVAFLDLDEPTQDQSYFTLKDTSKLMNRAFREHRVDVVGLVNQVVELVIRAGAAFKSEVAGDVLIVHLNGVWTYFNINSQIRSIQRSMCARLAVLSHETTGGDTFIYGGEGDIVVQDSHGLMRRCHISTMNTMGHQSFEITPLQEAA